ncbi:extracellular solute-binding protein [Paenibacillus sp. 1P07SE]|uniref:extracellular solute-binding protein n=1 Tax=Paenibacillus sp. 1P07SE TaxID=3132209 RepID=UPI0039A55829
MKKNRIGMKSMVVLISSMLLAACSNSPENSLGEQRDENLPKANNEQSTKEQAPNINTEGFPIVPNKIEVSMAMVQNPNAPETEKLKFFQRMEQDTNIQFNINAIPTTALLEKKNLLLASGDYPDVFFKMGITPEDEIVYGQQGIFIPLEDLIAEYAPNLSRIFEERPEVKKSVTTPSGHIYALPGLLQTGSTAHFYINKKWLDALGLEEPTNTDEFYQVLKAFKENDPNQNGLQDEIPMSTVQITHLQQFLHNFGLFPGTYTQDGTVQYSFNDSKYKDFLLFFKKLYDENLLDNESFTQNPQQIQAKGKAPDELLGVFFDAGAFLTVGEDRHFDYTTLLPFVTDDGQQIWTGSTGVQRGTFVITDKSEHPEALIRWADHLYGEEGSKLAWAGREGEEYSMNADGTWDWILGEGQAQNAVRGYGAIQGVQHIPGVKPLAFWDKINNEYEASLTEIRGRINKFEREAYPLLYLTPDQQKTVNAINADIVAYVNQFMAESITGAVDIEQEWDEYVSTLDKMRLDEMISIYQQAYDDYQALD